MNDLLRLHCFYKMSSIIFYARQIWQKIGLFVAFLLPSSAAFADCFDLAASYQGVNSHVLRAIAWQESRGHPNALHHNDNGTTDYGLMQINSTHLATLAQYGVTKRTLMDPCRSAFIGAWHLRRMMDKYGNTWAAIGAYHSETPIYRDSYARSVKRILESDAAFARFDTQHHSHPHHYQAFVNPVVSNERD